MVRVTVFNTHMAATRPDHRPPLSLDFHLHFSTSLHPVGTRLRHSSLESLNPKEGMSP